MSETDLSPDAISDEEAFWQIYETPFKESAATNATEWVSAAAAARLVLYRPLTKSGKIVADKDYGVLRDDAVWRPGTWRGVPAALIRERGLVVMTLEQLVCEVGPTLWRAETEGDLLDAGLVMLASQARVTTRIETWDERTARLFAADCAEHVLPVFERRHPGERRVRDWIALARRAADGLASPSEVGAGRREAWALHEELEDEAGERNYADGAVYAASSALSRPAWRGAQEASMAGTSAAAFAAVPGFIRRDEDFAAGRAAFLAEEAWQAMRLGDLLGIH